MKNWPPVPFLLSAVALVAVGALTPLTLPCPLDDGTGWLTAAPGLTVQNSVVKLVSEKPVFTFGECGTPVHRTKFTYSVSINLTNSSVEPVKGMVKVIFSRYAEGSKRYVQNAEGEMVEEEYAPPTVPAYVSVPAGTTKEVHLTLTYIDDPLAPGDPVPEAKITAGEGMIDPTCGGTGTLSFARWIEAKLRPPSFE